MSDEREILELAAKAIGCVHIDLAKRKGLELVTAEDAIGPFWMIDGSHQWHWNPIDDDGDALRLMVNLRLEVNVGTKCTRAVSKPIEEGVRVTVDHLSDPLESTRIAIVRAAAEIGRVMP